MRRSIWTTLGIERTRERTDIRRAYAAKLKQVHPEDDPDGFKTLREAYESAISYADQGFEVFSPAAFFSQDDADSDSEDVEDTDDADQFEWLVDHAEPADDAPAGQEQTALRALAAR